MHAPGYAPINENIPTLPLRGIWEPVSGEASVQVERDRPFLAGDGFGLAGSSEGGAEILTAAEEGRAKKDMSP